VFFSTEEEEEDDVTSVLRDRSHIDETLRLATEENAADYAGEDQIFTRSVFIKLYAGLYCI